MSVMYNEENSFRLDDENELLASESPLHGKENWNMSMTMINVATNETTKRGGLDWIMTAKYNNPQNGQGEASQ